MPLQKRLPKYGFTSRIGRTTAEVRLHELNPGEDYYLGVFLVGAYQETLGDLHNLFGDTNVVNVSVNRDGTFEFEREFHGDSIADVLSYVEYEPKQMQEQFRRVAEDAETKERAIVARDASDALVAADERSADLQSRLDAAEERAMSAAAEADGQLAQLAEESERLAETNLETEQVKQRVGASTAFEVQRRNQELREARSRLLRNQLDYRTAESRLLYAQGLLEAEPR